MVSVLDPDTGEPIGPAISLAQITVKAQERNFELPPGVTPVSAFAKSATLIIAVTGQLYLTILVAMLVGKLLSRTETG